MDSVLGAQVLRPDPSKGTHGQTILRRIGQCHDLGPVPAFASVEEPPHAGPAVPGAG